MNDVEYPALLARLRDLLPPEREDRLTAATWLLVTEAVDAGVDCKAGVGAIALAFPYAQAMQREARRS